MSSTKAVVVRVANRKNYLTAVIGFRIRSSSLSQIILCKLNCAFLYRKVISTPTQQVVGLPYYEKTKYPLSKIILTGQEKLYE